MLLLCSCWIATFLLKVMLFREWGSVGIESYLGRSERMPPSRNATLRGEPDDAAKSRGVMWDSLGLVMSAPLAKRSDVISFNHQLHEGCYHTKEASTFLSNEKAVWMGYMLLLWVELLLIAYLFPPIFFTLAPAYRRPLTAIEFLFQQACWLLDVR